MRYHRLLHFGFSIFSILFHPLLLVSYILLILFMHNPYLFGFNHISQGGIILIYTFVLSLLIPVIGILLLKGTGLISSLKMEKRMERIGPLILTSIFYLWFFINCKNNPEIPLIFILFVFGALCVLLLTFVVNVFIKTSIHTAGLSAMVVYFFTLFFAFNGVIDTNELFSWIVASIMTLGFVISGRLYLKAHNIPEIICGLILGVFSQLIAYIIIF